MLTLVGLVKSVLCLYFLASSSVYFIQIFLKIIVNQNSPWSIVHLPLFCLKVYDNPEGNLSSIRSSIINMFPCYNKHLQDPRGVIHCNCGCKSLLETKSIKALPFLYCQST